MRRALGTCEPAAYLGMAVMANGDVHIDAAQIEPEHAQALLAHLDYVRQRLETFISQHIPEGRMAQVIPIRPTA